MTITLSQSFVYALILIELVLIVTAILWVRGRVVSRSLTKKARQLESRWLGVGEGTRRLNPRQHLEFVIDSVTDYLHDCSSELDCSRDPAEERIRLAQPHAEDQGAITLSYSEERMVSPLTACNRIEVDLRAALERGQFELHYQPQVETTLATVVGAEALLRWNHPELGVVQPLQFIPIAEEINIVNEIGRWTINEVCSQIKQFNRDGLRLPVVAVNLSVLQVNMQLVDTLHNALEEHSLAASQLRLEFHEGVAMRDLGSTVRVLDALKQLGVGLCVDNFGTGSAPFGHLNQFPLDSIKVDRSILTRALSNQGDTVPLTTIVEIANKRQLGLIAEGVETHEQFQYLVRHGIQVLQGHLFSAPVSARELQPMLVPWHFDEMLRKLTNPLDLP